MWQQTNLLCKALLVFIHISRIKKADCERIQCGSKLGLSAFVSLQHLGKTSLQRLINEKNLNIVSFI